MPTAKFYTDSILEVVKNFEVKRYCRLGAMYDAVPHTRPLLVTGSLGAVSQIRPVPNLKLRGSTYQGPTTIMNLVSDGIDKLGVESINFMVHLPNTSNSMRTSTARQGCLKLYHPCTPTSQPTWHRPTWSTPISRTEFSRGTQCGASGPDPANGKRTTTQTRQKPLSQPRVNPNLTRCLCLPKSNSS